MSNSQTQQLEDKAKQDEKSFGRYFPTIFVAVGGTGAKVFERVRRATIERFGSLDENDLPGVAYVSIDTDVGSQTAGHQQDADTKSSELNKLMSYSEKERLTLDGSRIRHYIENQATLASYPHISEWFDPLLMETAKGMDISTGAGQIRPIARLVAWDNRDAIVSKFNRAFNDVTSLRSADAAKRVIAGDKVNVVLCGSLAGGTGAGIFLDVAAMIRDAQPKVNVTGIFVLPEVFSAHDDAAKPKANGYAALAELNYYSTEPYRARWEPTGKPVEIPVMFDRVYLFDKNNESGQAITRSADAYDIIGDALFLDFCQGGFAFVRNSVQVNRAQTLLQIHKHTRQLAPPKWKVQGQGARGLVTQAEMESYRQRFQSMGLSRVACSSWRVLNQMSYWLAQQMIDFLDNREELINDELPLKRTFAQKLGIFQGETTTDDGLGVRQYQVRDALGANPTNTGGLSTIDEAIGLHFLDLTTDDARNGWWDDKTTGQELRRLDLSMRAKWAGVDGEGVTGAFVEQIARNRAVLFRQVTQRLNEVIEEFCERSDVGPHRIAVVMRRLCAEILNSEVFWIKEMEKVAEQARADASMWEADWGKWSKLAAESDGRFTGLGKGGWQEQCQKAQEAANNLWTAVARRRIAQDAAGLLREVVTYVQSEGIDKQDALAMRLADIRRSFEKFNQEYARPRPSPVFTVVDDSEAENQATLAALKMAYLGTTADKQKAALRHLFDRTRAHLKIRTNRELRERVETQKEKFIRDFRYCCWLALRGAQGKTDWFGEVKDALIERQSINDYLLKRYGAPNAKEIAELAQEAYKKALPWVKVHEEVALRGVQRDCYVVLPTSTPQNAAVGEAFFAAVKAAATSTSGMNVNKVEGADASEFLIYVETSGLIPASISSLHSATGMAASYRQLADTRKQQNIKSFLHLDRDVVRFPNLVPMKPAESERVLAAWRLYLLGVLVGVIKTKRNVLRSDPTEQTTHPIFMFAYEGPGSNEVIELGQWQSAIREITDNAGLQQKLTDMVNRQYVDQAAARYERLLALVLYYRLCVFPLKKAKQDEGHDQQPRATLAYMALEQIEQELLSSWKSSKQASDADISDLMGEGGAVSQLLWGIKEFTLHAGQEDDSAALCRGLADTDYSETPPKRGYEEDTEVARRQKLRDLSYELLPRHLQANPALREQSLYYPWLRLAPRFAFFMPSMHQGAAPDPADPQRREKLVELSVREAIERLTSSPKDSNERCGAKFWWHPVGRTKGEYVDWHKVPGLKDAYVAAGGVIDTSPCAPSLPPLPASLSSSTVGTLTYAGPTGTGLSLSPIEIVQRIRAHEAGPHHVLMNQAWTPAAEHPEVKPLLTQSMPPLPSTSTTPSFPPLPATSPPVAAAPRFHFVAPPTMTTPAELDVPAIVAAIRSQPGSNHLVLVAGAWAPAVTVPEVAVALAPSLPPIPGTLPPVPTAQSAVSPSLPPVPSSSWPFAGGGITTWQSMTGEQIVQAVLAIAPGADAHVVVNGVATKVMDVPELAAAITARRR